MTPWPSLLPWLLALALVRGFIYASFVPPWQAPDEPAQFERARAALTAAEWNSSSENGPDWYQHLARSLFTHNFWDFLPGPRPEYSPAAPLNRYIVLYHEFYSGLYASRPPSAVMGWPSFLAPDLDITLQLYLARLNTVLMNVAIIFLAYLITRLIFPNDPFLGWGVPILILFNPQHTYLLAAVNNGNLAELLAAAALYFMVKGIIKGFSWLNLAAVLGFSLAAMWTKATAYFLPFAIAALALFYLWQYRRHWPWLLPAGLLLAGLIYLFSPERLKALLAAAFAVLQRGQIRLDPIVPIVQFRSFWALPGWLTLHLHPFWYQVLAIACILALVGLGLLLVERWPQLFSRQLQPRTKALILLAVAIIASAAILLGWSALANTIAYRQGRSLYPVIIPLSLFLMLGWRQLIPPAYRKLGLLTLAAVLFLFDSLVLFYYMMPFFYSRYY